MNDCPWMPWYVDDWLNDPEVRLMSRVARSVYFDMLCLQWKRGPLPDDAGQLARMLGDDRRTIAAVLPSIRHRFAVDSNANLVHIRLESERNRARIKSDNQRNNANKRWSAYATGHTESMPPGNAMAMPSESDPDPDPQSDRKKHLSPSASLDLLTLPDSGFDLQQIYAVYPRKGPGKHEGLKRLKAQIKTLEAFEECLAAARNYAEKIAAEKPEKKYVMQFSTWSNGRWRDYVDGPHIEETKRGAAVKTGWREPMEHVAETREEKI